jgi:hypothetical protein
MKVADGLQVGDRVFGHGQNAVFKILAIDRVLGSASLRQVGTGFRINKVPLSTLTLSVAARL